MADFKLLNYAGPDGLPRAGILVGTDAVIDLQAALPDKAWTASTLAVLKAWDVALPALHALADSPSNTRSLTQTKLLAPLYYPPAIYCAGSNYVEHGNEMVKDGGAIDTTKTTPYFFLKSGPHCITDPGAPIRLPSTSQKVDWEAEFAVVIGKAGRNIAREDVMKHVAGYTIMNDLSSRDLNMRHDDFARWKTDWFAHKNFDGSAPMGPWITPADQVADPYQLRLQLWVNEEKKQDSLVAGLIFKIPEMIHYLSRRMTLLPGDVIATGTPSGVGRPKGTFLKPGDKVRIELSDVGVLENPVVQGL